MNTVEFVTTVPYCPNPYCPKPNHIKPCWCRGVARCLGVKRNGEQCTRSAGDEHVLCWQHRKWSSA